MRRTIIIGLVLTLVALAGGAWASDGCVEISQVNVATAGTISAPGCYVLTSDLSQGLTVSSVDGVTLDLNGFTVAPGSGTPAVTLNCPVDNLEVRDGTLETTAADAVSCFCGGVEMVNHVYRNLRIRSENIGVLYNLGEGGMDNLQLENVVVHSLGVGVYLQGNEGDVLWRNLRFHRTEIRSEANAFIMSPSSLGITRTYGFQLESSALVSSTPNAVWFSLGNAEENEFEGSIRDCELVATDDGAGGVVWLDVAKGALHCVNNNILTVNSGVQTNSAFFTPTAILRAPIVIHGNTSSVGPNPVVGTVVSPPIGHDGTNPVVSNYDSYSGPY